MNYKPISISWKSRRLFAALLIGSAMVAACGSGDDSTVGDESAASAGKSTPAPTSDETGSAAAEEADGVITASLNDTERSWYITSAERGGQRISQSDWSPLFADQVSVSIMGHVSPSSFGSNEAIMMGFTLQGTGQNPAVSDASITYLSGGITDNHSSSHDGTANVSVSNASIDGDILSVSGTFSGSLPFKSMRGESDVESQETIVVEGGTFEGEIRRLQDM